MFWRKKTKEPDEPTKDEELKETLKQKFEDYEADEELHESSFDIDKHGIKNHDEPAVIDNWEDFEDII